MHKYSFSWSCIHFLTVSTHWPLDLSMPGSSFIALLISYLTSKVTEGKSAAHFISPLFPEGRLLLNDLGFEMRSNTHREIERYNIITDLNSSWKEKGISRAKFDGTQEEEEDEESRND